MRLSLALSLAVIFTAPLSAQFVITVQQNGSSVNAANGGSIILNSPAVGQTATATVTLTYFDPGTVTLTMPTIPGSTRFTSTAAPVTLTSFQSTTFNIVYNAVDATQSTAQFLFPFSQVGPGPTATPIGNGVISFSLIGTAPNIVISQVSSGNTFTAVANGGVFSFPATLVGSPSTLTIAISNLGSGPAMINSITATGAGFQALGVPLLPLALNPNTQLNVTAQFQPSMTGLFTGSLTVASANGTFTASLTGNGVTSFLSYVVVQGGETSGLIPNQTITLANTSVGAKSSSVIQFTNTNSMAIIVSGVAISGTGFSITDAPALPETLQPGQSDSITVTYAPNTPGPFTGRLVIGSDDFALSALALGPALQYSYTAGNSQVIANVGDTISFPPIAAGQTESLNFTVTNNGTSPTSLVSIGVIGTNGVFQVGNLPALPLQLNPNASASFSISFSPVAGGQASTTLLINSQGFTLSGFSSAPVTSSLPSFQFTGASGVQQPFQQPAIGLSLASPYPVALTGTLTISQASPYFFTDPAVQFSSGGQQAAFTIPANTLAAVFAGGLTQIRIQTGTVAGTILITPSFSIASTGTNITPANQTTLQITVTALAPVLLSASIGTRTTTTLSIVVTGYSTTRNLTTMSVQFTPNAGYTLNETSATVDLSAASEVFYGSSASQSSGGQFSVEIPFTFGSGTSAANLTTSISSISVSASNAIGSSNTLMIAVP